MSTYGGRSGFERMKTYVGLLFAVLALIAFIEPTASAVAASTGTPSSAQVLTPTTATTATHQQGPEHDVMVTHQIRHHVPSAVVQRRGGRGHTGALTRAPKGPWPTGRLTLVTGLVRPSDRLLHRTVTTIRLRM